MDSMDSMDSIDIDELIAGAVDMMGSGIMLGSGDMSGSGDMAGSGEIDMEDVVEGVMELFGEFIQDLLGASDEELETLGEMVQGMMAEAGGISDVADMLLGEAGLLEELMESDEAVMALCAVVDMLAGDEEMPEVDEMDDAEEIRRRLPGAGPKEAAVVGVLHGFNAVRRNMGGAPPAVPSGPETPVDVGPPSESDETPV